MTTDTQPPVGMSVWGRDLFEHLVKHMHDENELIDEYDELASRAGGHVAYVLGLIVEDEQRHHRLFEEWCNALRSDAEFRSIEPKVPTLDADLDPAEVKAAVERFLEVERADRKELDRLRKLVRGQRDTSLWDVLLEVMELDTQKHIALLRFLEHHPG
jgi:hypothetical protein